MDSRSYRIIWTGLVLATVALALMGAWVSADAAQRGCAPGAAAAAPVGSGSCPV